MKIELDPQAEYVKDGKFDLKSALINAGVKAAVCFKETKDNKVISPNEIRMDEDDEKLLLRGINTILSDHTSPTEQQTIALEITGIPKILCMVLNNENDYAADERSLRYTKVEENEYISQLEVEKYNFWLDTIEKLINKKYGDFYNSISKSEKQASSSMRKLAQENARYMVSVFMPTTLTYKVSLAQINKICLYMERIIKSPTTELEELLVPYFIDFINQLKKLNVVVTNNSIYEISKTLSEDNFNKLLKQIPNLNNYLNDETLFYKNNKQVDLSLFANKNPFSGINLKNEFGVNISYNHEISFACLAQEQRHRTLDCEMIVPDEFSFFVPPILSGEGSLQVKWVEDMMSVANIYPQGQLVKVNLTGSLKRIINFVSKERCCTKAQLEIEKLYVDELLPAIYENLILTNQETLANEVKPYVKKLRCAFPTYKCPTPCRLNKNLNRDL